MKRILKKIIPTGLASAIRSALKVPLICVYYPRDIIRYLRYSASLAQNANLSTLEAKVIADSHIIEKGLSLRNPRLGFGKQVIIRLIEAIKLYHKRKYPTDLFGHKFAVSILHKYLEFNIQNGYDVSDLEDSIRSFDNKGIEDMAGTRSFTKSQMLNDCVKSFPKLLNSRFSLRQFSGETVEMKIVEEAVRLASFSPSVCNRQSTKVYVVEDNEIKNKVIELQKGTRGFGEEIDKMIIVSSDITLFFGLQERYQSYVDGGLFSMNLLYALTYLGIGSCSLNWCAEPHRDKELKKLINANDCENIIMIVGIGHMPDVFKVAKSPRRDIKDIMVKI